HRLLAVAAEALHGVRHCVLRRQWQHDQREREADDKKGEDQLPRANHFLAPVLVALLVALAAPSSSDFSGGGSFRSTTTPPSKNTTAPWSRISARAACKVPSGNVALTGFFVTMRPCFTSMKASLR